MKFSIVTISFNQAKYVRQCIDSVLNQKYHNIQYIIVDPGSTDGSRDVISSYGERVVKVFSPDKGPADGLNKGFSLAIGDILYFLNADDYLEADALSHVRDCFISRNNIDVVLGEGYIDYGSRKSIIKPEPLTSELLLTRACRIFQQGTFFTRDLFLKSGGFNVNNRTSWDYELFVAFARLKARCLITNKRLASFRVHSESISGSGRLNERYRRDLDRIYHEETGKRWGVFPACRSIVRRSAAYLRRRCLE